MSKERTKKYNGICRKYEFRITKADDDSGYFVATGRIGGHTRSTFFTDGSSENDIFDMVADALKCMLDVKVPWYDKLWYRLTRFLRQ